MICRPVLGKVSSLNPYLEELQVSGPHLARNQGVALAFPAVAKIRSKVKHRPVSTHYCLLKLEAGLHGQIV